MIGFADKLETGHANKLFWHRSACLTGIAMNNSRAGKWVKPLSATLVAALALFAWNHYRPPGGTLSLPVSAPESTTRNQVYFGSRNSIAVLPFEGGSAGPEEAFWAPGFSSELQRLMTRNQGMQVTSRNSSFYFQDPSIPPRVIAERLQCAHLLAGGFQTSDGRVRVSARLWDAEKDREVWSQDYERDLDDVFAIQEEILASVAEAMRPVPGGALPQAETVDTDAWAFYLQGLHLRRQRTPNGYQDAEIAFLSALEIEPGYEMARVGLAETWLEREAAGDGESLLVENARDALATALQSRPDLPDAQGLLSYIRRNYDWDWRGAQDAAERAIGLNPGDPELMSIVSLAMFSLGEFEQAGEFLEAAVRLDPLNLSRRLRLGLLQEFSGNYEQSLSSYRQIIGLNAEFPGARAYRARVKIIQEKPESAMRESEQEIDPFWKRYSEILALIAQERHQEAELLLQQMIGEDGHHAAYQITEIQAFRGDIEAAFDWFKRAHDQRDGGMSEIIGNYFLQNLQGDPRWQEMLRLMDLPQKDAARR
jgi:TolB-like protein/TPR repeat protein